MNRRTLIRTLVTGLLLATPALCFSTPCAGQERGRPADRPEIRWQEHTGRARDGSPLPGRIGRIQVPENRSSADGRTIELAFVHYETTNPNPTAPVFFLAGGPGGPGIGNCEYYATAPELALLDHCDVIGLDQRGTGLSRPNLSDGPDFSWRLRLDRAITREDVIEADRAALSRMVKHWSEKGVDLAAYNTVESADDLDAVRRALELEEIVLFGASYGSHLGLAYLRRHDEHVERAVLMKVEGPDQTWKLPSQIQAQFQRLHQLIAADPGASEKIPDFLGTMRELLDQLEQEPVTVTLDPGGSREVTIVCGPYDLQRGLTMLLANRQGLAQAPMALYPYTQGDWTTLGKVGLRTRVGGPESAMTWMMDCASGATRERRQRIERERNDPANLASDAFDGYYSEPCDACGDPDLGDAFRGPLECYVPVLFVSGDLDARTPPSNVEEIREGFANHAHIVVENAGHGPDELKSEEFCELLLAFLEGEEVESRTITLPPIEFLPIRTR